MENVTVYESEDGKLITIKLSREKYDRSRMIIMVEFFYKEANNKTDTGLFKRGFWIDPSLKPNFARDLSRAIDQLERMKNEANVYKLGKEAEGNITFILGKDWGYYWNEQGQWICRGPMIFEYKGVGTRVNDDWITPLPLIALLDHLKKLNGLLSKN